MLGPNGEKKWRSRVKCVGEPITTTASSKTMVV